LRAGWQHNQSNQQDGFHTFSGSGFKGPEIGNRVSLARALSPDVRYDRLVLDDPDSCGWAAETRKWPLRQGIATIPPS
jgi:hypothetical protein